MGNRNLPLRLIFPTDVFPPRSGGAGWSTHALALALIERGHDVTALVPQRGASAVTCAEVLGVPTMRFGYRAPDLPFVQNYFRHERLWQPLAEAIVEASAQKAEHRARSSSLIPHSSSLIHAQHVQVTPAAILAGERLGAPVVVTVRDHWPWDYFATGLHGDRLPHPRQSWASLATDLPMRLGPLRGTSALPAIPYMLAHLRRRQSFLRRADAVIACSGYIAGRLAGIVPAERLHVIPHLVDLAQIDRIAATPPQRVAPDKRFVLFAGKLERNKGAHLLLDIFREVREGTCPTLVVAGNGPLRGELEQGLAALGVPARFLDWADHDEVLRLTARCELLLFPSAWGEPLSRVLLEACACRAAILAMPTGGTPDLIVDEVSGALAATPAHFAQRMVELLARTDKRRALGDGARRVAEQRLAKDVVAEQIEVLYRTLLAARSAHGLRG